MPLNIRRQQNPALGRIAILLYGQPKVGKTTAAAQFPEPLVLNCERGTAFLEGVDIVDVTSIAELNTVAGEIAANTDLGYKTIVVDGLTGLVRQEIARQKKHSKDPRIAFQTITETLMEAMDLLHSAGKIIVATGTSRKRSETEPRQKDKTVTIAPDFNPALVDDIVAMFDLVLYCFLGRNGRMMLTKPTIRGNTTILAGDRSGKLPEIMPLSAQTLMETLRNAVAG